MCEGEEEQASIQEARRQWFMLKHPSWTRLPRYPNNVTIYSFPNVRFLYFTYCHRWCPTSRRNKYCVDCTTLISGPGGSGLFKIPKLTKIDINCSTGLNKNIIPKVDESKSLMTRTDAPNESSYYNPSESRGLLPQEDQSVDTRAQALEDHDGEEADNAEEDIKNEDK